MIKRTIHILLLCGFTVVIVSSCVLNRNLPTPTDRVPREEWITDWLENPVCQPPCWENIIVGTSTITESINILNRMAGIYITGPLKNDINNTTTISWEYQNSQSVGGVETGKKGDIVTQLHISIDQNQKVSLGEIIHRYGYPDFILLRRCHGFAIDFSCQNDLIYEKGLALGLILPIKHNKFEITVDSDVDSIKLFTNGILGYEDEYGWYGLNIQESLRSWNGYTKYDYP